MAFRGRGGQLGCRMQQKEPGVFGKDGGGVGAVIVSQHSLRKIMQFVWAKELFVLRARLSD